MYKMSRPWDYQGQDWNQYIENSRKFKNLPRINKNKQFTFQLQILIIVNLIHVQMVVTARPMIKLMALFVIVQKDGVASLAQV